MIIITKDTMQDYVLQNVILTKVCKVKSDEDSKESKSINLKVKYNDVTVDDLAQATLGQGVTVNWQNGAEGRKNYANLVNNGTVEVDFKSPGRKADIDPEEATVAKLATMTPEEQLAYFKGLMARANPVPVVDEEVVDEDEGEDLESIQANYKLRKGNQAG